MINIGNPSKGYRLSSMPDILSSKEIRDRIKKGIHRKTALIGREIHIFQEIDSTNLKGMDLGKRGSPEGTIILAETQSNGRGRLGRKWISPEGNIYLSVILRPEISPSHAPLITLMAAVASASSLKNNLNIPASIKWPNDILIEGKKVGGILTEMNSGMDKINFIVLGIGINVNMDISILPPDVRAISTSIKDTIGGSVSRIEVLSSLLKELDKWYNIFIENGSGPILKEWRALSSNLGKRVMAASLNGVMEGVAMDIDDYGRLILKLDNGSIEKITSGDVTVIPNCKLQN